MGILLRYRCYCEPVGSTVFNCSEIFNPLGTFAVIFIKLINPRVSKLIYSYG